MKTPSIALLLLLAGNAALLSQTSTRQTGQYLGETRGERGFGTAVVAVPDLNGNGARDLIISTPVTSNQAGSVVTSMEARDGDTGDEIWRYVGQNLLGVGRRLTVIDDLDQDGFPEIAMPWDLAGGSAVAIHSSQTGAQLSVWGLAGLGGIPFATFVSGPDVTGDGIGELVIAGVATALAPNGAVLQVNPLTGQVAASAVVSLSFPGVLVESGALVGDLDGDLIEDLAFGLPGASGGALTFGAGAIVILSGADLSLIDEVTGTTYQGRLGRSLASGFDLTNDGVPEIYAGASGLVVPTVLASPSGEVVIFDGATRQLLTSIGAPPGFEAFGTSLATRSSFTGKRLLIVAGDDTGSPVGGQVAVAVEFDLDSLFGLPTTYLIPEGVLTGLRPVLHGVGDLNGDTVADLAIAIPGSGTIPGSVGLFRAPAALTYGGNAGANTLVFEPAGATTLFRITSGPPLAPGLLVIGFERASVPFANGTRLVDLTDASFLPVTLGPTGLGFFILSQPLPPQLQSQTFRAQVAVLDGQQAGGVSLSNGVEVTF